VSRYLQSGRRFRSYLGYSFCRFGCGVPDRNMGDSDLTDGVWVWPEGLAHYVVLHRVNLPATLIETMETNLWIVPPVDETVALADVSAAWWVAWARSHPYRSCS
jgi:hypothetical protein